MVSHKYRPVSAKNLVGFVVGDVNYAVPISAVREIVSPLEITQLPHAPASVAGVADHRGEVLPIVDLRVRFGVRESRDERRAKWILVDCAGRSVGLIVDRVTDVFGATGEGLRPAPALGTGDDVRGIVGVTTLEGDLTFVLDVSRFDELTRALDPSSIAQLSELAGVKVAT